MKVAFIPPRGLTQRIFESTYAMALAHLLLPDEKDKLYASTITSFVNVPSNVLLLDNGAAEHSQVANKDLVEIAKLYGPYETVLPDVMGNAEATLQAVEKFVTTKTYGNRRYMAVLQGTTERELQTCVQFYSQFEHIKTVGIPRLLLDQPNFAQDIRLTMADWINRKFEHRFQIHLLGTNTKWIKEAYFAAKYAPHIRSVDTSMPYNYTIKRLKLDDAAKDRVQVNRVTDYFTKDWRLCIDTALMKHNEQVMKSWVEQA